MTRSAAVAVVGLLMACAGEDGTMGPAGPAGADGDPGAMFDEIRLCTHYDATRGLEFTYEISSFTTGEAQAFCTVTDAWASYSAAYSWPSGTVGAVQGLCFVGYDLDAGSGGYFEFRADGSTRVIYRDSSSTLNGTAVSFLSGDCNT